MYNVYIQILSASCIYLITMYSPKFTMLQLEIILDNYLTVLMKM